MVADGTLYEHIEQVSEVVSEAERKRKRIKYV